MRGKRRKVAEVLEQYRHGGEEGPRHYQFRVRLGCGHVVKAMASDRYAKDARPVIGYCTLCSALEVSP